MYVIEGNKILDNLEQIKMIFNTLVKNIKFS